MFGSPAKFPEAQEPAAGDTGPPATTTFDAGADELDDEEEDEEEDEAEFDEEPTDEDAEEGDVGSSRLVLLEN
jgi:hypothetical protein